ncbi:lysoplasmalogenase [Reichenbachiella versicolor]|uniref:lysoplasmalogenase n=1 Tax=Reichenbachiella versicolor TaxID=1821036 RepID=UPI000D6E7C64|nr:lysoplasmalogenase [Reichenbachiella versicolor]
MSDEKQAIYLKYAYIVVAALEILALMLDIDRLHHLAKPLLMPLLLVYFRKGLKGRLSSSFMLAVLGLLFSFVGDSAFMFADDNQLFFLLGLGAFSITQIMYSVSFNKAIDLDSAKPNKLMKVLYAVPLLIVLGGVLNMVWDKVSVELFAAMAIYSLLSLNMVLSAVLRHGRASVEGTKQVILGAVFFMFSGVLLVLDRFHVPMNNAQVFIMAPYILAQWHIINGLQKFYNETSSY